MNNDTTKRRQVITIQVDGTMSGLQVKPGQGIDLTQFGNAKVTRASEIVWHEGEQAWMIDVLQEAGRGAVTIVRLLNAWGGREEFCLEDADDAKVAKTIGYGIKKFCRAEVRYDLTLDAVPLFASYDDAVRIEIEYLNALRLQGQY